MTLKNKKVVDIQKYKKKNTPSAKKRRKIINNLKDYYFVKNKFSFKNFFLTFLYVFFVLLIGLGIYSAITK